MIPATIDDISNVDDQQFMMEVYQKYHRLMYHLAKKWIDDSIIRDDIVQDVLVKLIQKVSLLRQLDNARLVSYIAHTVRNTTIKQLTSRSKIDRNMESLSIDELSNEAVDRFITPEDHVVQKEEWEMFHRVWMDLPDRERLLLEGKYLLRHSDEELSEWLGCKPGSVRMALTRARRTVLNELRRRENDDTSGKTSGTV